MRTGPLGLSALLLLCAGPSRGQDVVRPVDAFFADEVWAKVGELTCRNCHTVQGDAADSEFILRDGDLDADALRRNREAFAKMAAARTKDGKSRLLQKASGAVKHGGNQALKPGSTGFKILERFVATLDAPPAGRDSAPPPFFQGVAMASPSRLLRRVTLSLAGRLPSAEERSAVEKNRWDPVLDAILREDAFYERLKEGFNDIFLTLGYNGNGPDALSYDHFEKTRHWTQKHDLSHIADEGERRKAGYKLANDYDKALRREPLELIVHIVKNEKPFTEIVTADYIMVSPYTARGYGIFEAVREKFKNLDDPFEYVPARLPALKGRNGKVQPTAEGVYPHSGLLTMFQYLRRHPTTATNRNRLRARMYYKHFLGIDVMALAPRVTDAAAVDAKFANPPMEAPDCVVCHKTVDPVAGLFQDYFNEEGHYGPRKEGWFADMFGPGLEGEALPEADRWRALQWLGRKTAKDPRFAVAMVEHVYYFLMGRAPMLAPQDIDDPQFTAKRRAHLELRREIKRIADRFAKAGFNLKSVFKDLVASPFYRVDGLSEPLTKEPPTSVNKAPLTNLGGGSVNSRRAELEDVGVVRLLTPEQLERKITAVFGYRWGRLSDDSKYGILYGGIDSKAVTERMTEPSGAMGALQRIMANEVACNTVPADFKKEAGQRRLFPYVELTDLPGTPEADRKIRQAVVHLHAHVLGREQAVDHPDVDRTFRLFAGIVEDAKAQKGLDKRESYFCRAQKEEGRSDDPHYTLRAWRAVVTYLLRQDDFLYE